MMEKEKNLEELMAAIGDGSTPNNNPQTAFPGAGLSTPIQMPRTNPVPTRTPASAPGVVPNFNGNMAGNLNELVSLLRGPPNPRASAAGSPQNIPTAVTPAYSTNPMQLMAQQQQQRSLTQQQTSRGIPGLSNPVLNPKASAQFRRQQLQAAKDLQKREALLAAASRVTVPGISPGKAVGAQPGDITAELKQVMRDSSSSEASKSNSVSRSSTVQRKAVQRQRAPPAAEASSGQSRQITQEQIILGHFCRHAIKTLSRIMQGNPNRQRTETRLKDHIKNTWAQWVRKMIPRQRLLESVASFVRSSCPEALNIDVIGEFKTWYEREFELQKRRSTDAMKAQQIQQQQQKQQQLQTQQGQIAQQKHSGKATNSFSSGGARDQGPQAHGGAGKVFTPAIADIRNMVGANPVLNREAQISKTEPQLAKVDPPFVPGRTGGKSVSSKTVPIRKTPTKNAKNTATKAVGSKTVGSKTVSQHPAMQNIAAVQMQAVMKGTTAPNIMQMSGAGGGVAGKSVTGHKGLVANKLPTIMKSKGQRRPPTKAAQKAAVKQKGKISPKGAVSTAAAKQKGPPSVSNPNMIATLTNTTPPPVTGKRPLDANIGSPVGSASKKPKPNSKGPKGAVGRKKNPVVLPPINTGKNEKPPPAKADMSKGRPPLGPSGGSGSLPIAGGNAKTGALVPGTTTPGQVPVKRAKGVDDELSVVHNVVDIENEEDMLGRDASGGSDDVVEVMQYDADMLLVGPTLRAKMQNSAKRYGLDPNISKDAMEMVSLAVRERLACVLENLREIAGVRLESSKSQWTTEPVGPNVHDKLEEMRQNEERSLTVAAEMRVKRKKDAEEREAKKIAGDAEKEEKKAKDSSAAAEQERKEKLALEKKRKETSNMRDALSGLVAGFDKRRKKPNGAKGLAPLVPLSKLGSGGGSRSSGSALPPIPRMSGSGLPALGKGKGMEKKSKLDPLEKMKPHGPLVKLGGVRQSSMPGVRGKDEVVKMLQPKCVLTLRDCLFFMESSHNMRKSSLLYKWYARLGMKEMREDSHASK